MHRYPGNQLDGEQQGQRRPGGDHLAHRVGLGVQDVRGDGRGHAKQQRGANSPADAAKLWKGHGGNSCPGRSSLGVGAPSFAIRRRAPAYSARVSRAVLNPGTGRSPFPRNGFRDPCPNATTTVREDGRWRRTARRPSCPELIVCPLWTVERHNFPGNWNGGRGGRPTQDAPATGSGGQARDPRRQEPPARHPLGDAAAVQVRRDTAQMERPTGAHPHVTVLERRGCTRRLRRHRPRQKPLCLLTTAWDGCGSPHA